MSLEVFVHEVDRCIEVEGVVLVRPESEAFLAGKVAWPAEPPPEWTTPALVCGASAAAALISLLLWRLSSAFVVAFSVSLLCLLVAGAVAFGRWSIRNSPELPVAILRGSVSEYSMPTRVGSQTIDAEYRSPVTGLTNRVAFKSTSAEVGRLGLSRGAPVYVLYFDDNRALVL